MDCITFISMLEGFLVLSKVIMVSSKLCSSPQVMFQLTILIVWFAMLLFFGSFFYISAKKVMFLLVFVHSSVSLSAGLSKNY